MAETRSQFRIVRGETTAQPQRKSAAFAASGCGDGARPWAFWEISLVADKVKICWNEDRQGADVNYCQYPCKFAINGVKMSLLMLAAKKTKLHIVETIVNHPSLQLYHRDQNGRNVAHYAI